MFLNTRSMSAMCLGQVLTALVLLALTSCSNEPPSTTAPRVEIGSEELMAKLRSTYAQAESYSDNASLVERGVNRSRGTMDEIPYSSTAVVFARPNRYAVTYEYGVANSEGATRYRVVSDGERVRSAADELPEQIHEAIAPRRTTVENFIAEPELRRVMLEVGVENLFPQLALLLASDPEKPVFRRATKMEVLPDATLDGVDCYRLALTEPEGTRVLWIDKQKYYLRRMELPIEKQRAQMGPVNQFSKFSVELDFENVVFDAEYGDKALSMEVPENVRLVRRFIPPAPEPPSEELGKKLDEFKFAALDGTEVSLASLAGKTCVFEFWSTDCAPCKQNMPTLEAAYQKVKDASDVAFYAVSNDPNGLANDIVEKTLRSWGGTFPILRDMDRTSFQKLGVQATPTLMLISGDGKLQGVHVGPLEDADQLVKKVEQMQSGVDLMEEAHKQHAQEIADHKATFEAATLEESLTEIPSKPAPVAEKSEPETLSVERLWQSKHADLGKPGDVAVALQQDGGVEEILVLDGNETIVRYDSEGQVLGRVKLPEHKEETPGVIRVSNGGQSPKQFLVTGPGWQRAYLYDNDGKLLLSFPDEPHSGIGDAIFLSTAKDGAADLFVGYRGGRGVERGTAEGQRVWVNQYLDHVQQVAPGPTPKSGSTFIWSTSTRGTVFEIASDNKFQREFPVVGHTIVSVGPQLADDQKIHFGISLVAPSKYAVVGFDNLGHVTWEYPLREGDYYDAMPLIYSVSLPDEGECLLVAGPDGSLHVLTAEGELVDRWNSGDIITGLAAYSTPEGAIALISAGNRLAAWRIAQKAGP